MFNALPVNPVVSRLKSAGRRSAIVASFALVFCGAVPHSFAQDRAPSLTSWTDSSGSKTIEAEFVKLDGVTLVLRKADGKEVKLPLSKLDDKSRIKARAMAKGGSPAPAPSGTETKASSSPVSVTIPPVVQFPSNPSAQEFFDIITTEFKKENALVVWDALPANKQKQIEDLVKLAASRVEQRTFDQIKRFRGDVIKTLKTKKEFVLNSSMIPIPPDQKPLLVNAYDGIVEMVEAYIPETLLDTNKLQQSKLRELVGNYLGTLQVKGKALVDTLPADHPLRAMASPQPPEMKVVSSSGSEATVSITVPGQPAVPPVKFILVDGRWLPAELNANWDTAIAQATQGLQAADPKAIHKAVGQGVLGATAFIGAFSAAETQSDFDEAIGQLMSMGQMMGGMAGGGAPGAPPAGGAFPGSAE